MTETYTIQEAWENACMETAPGNINQTVKCDIYTAYQRQVSLNWNSLGIK